MAKLRNAHAALELRVHERTKELNKLNETLELRVVERTGELQTVNASLRDSRRATLNMMEDALAAGKRAEKTNAELQSEIAERKRAEQETQRLLHVVQEEKDRLSALINSINDEIWFADSEKKFTLANPSALAGVRH